MHDLLHCHWKHRGKIKAAGLQNYCWFVVNSVADRNYISYCRKLIPHHFQNWIKPQFLPGTHVGQIHQQYHGSAFKENLYLNLKAFFFLFFRRTRIHSFQSQLASMTSFSGEVSHTNLLNPQQNTFDAVPSLVYVPQLESSLPISSPLPPATPGCKVGTGAQHRNSRHFATENPGSKDKIGNEKRIMTAMNICIKKIPT